MAVSKLKVAVRRIQLKKVIHFQLIAWLGTLVNFAVLWFLHGRLKIPLLIAGGAAVEIAIIHNFTWNYCKTWNHRVKHTLPDYFILLVKYNLVTASIDIVVNLGILWLLTHYLKVHYLLANLVGQIMGPVFKFLANEFFIFKPKDGSQHSLQPEKTKKAI